MSKLQKRVLAVFVALVLTLAVGALQAGFGINSDQALDASDPATGLWRMAGDTEDADGGG